MGAVAMRSVILIALAVYVAGETSVYSTGNPHITSQTKLVDEQRCNAATTSGGLCLKDINFAAAITAPLVTQQDTFLRSITVRHQGVPLNIYAFRQPARLSELELPFRILPMRAIDLTGVVEIPVAPKEAIDSWFPGYSWSILVCTGCGEPMHIGWKFTSPTDHFYGLIVDYKSDDEAEATGKASLGEVVAEQLQIGARAPAWMLALLAAAVPAK